MIAAKMIGKRAWCDQPGCPNQYSLARITLADDGSLHARLERHRWRPYGFTDGLPRYVNVKRTGRRVGKTPSGQDLRSRNLDIRAPCPIVVECPACMTAQVIGLTPPTSSR